MSGKSVDINVGIDWGKVSFDISQHFNLNFLEVKELLEERNQNYFVTIVDGMRNSILIVDDTRISKIWI